jgi:hypothetical protein
LSLEISHSSAMKLHKGLKIFIYKTKQKHIWQHICIVFHCSHISSCLCHPQRIQTPNLKLAKIQQIPSIIFIICSIQQTDSKCWVVHIHKHIMSTPPYKSIMILQFM